MREFVERLWAPLYFLLFAAILIVQLFLPPSIGLADNADSGRIIGGHGLVPNYPPAERYFLYFTPDYLKTPANPADFVPLGFTGCFAFGIADWLGQLKSHDHFDVRYIGFVHMVFYLFNFALLLALLRSAPTLVKWVMPAIVIWAFGDVFYVEFLNSLFLDTMGFICFLTLLLALIAIWRRQASIWAVLLFAIAAIAFAYSKPLNAPVAALFGIGVCADALLFQRKPRRRLFVAGGVAAVIGLWITATTPRWYSAPAVVNVVMMRLAVLPNAQGHLLFFGLAPSDIQYAGKDAFRADGPTSDPGFLARFAHITPVTLARWYATHPADTARMLRDDFVKSAPRLRPQYDLRPLGDLEKPYCTGPRVDHFGSWSDLQTKILHQAFLIPLVYVFALTMSALTILSRRWRTCSGFGLTLGLVTLSGVFQFVCGSLLDTIETSRHLFMFHVCTDAMLVLLLGAFMSWGSDRWTQSQNRPAIALL